MHTTQAAVFTDLYVESVILWLQPPSDKVHLGAEVSVFIFVRSVANWNAKPTRACSWWRTGSCAAKPSSSRQQRRRTTVRGCRPKLQCWIVSVGWETQCGINYILLSDWTVPGITVAFQHLMVSIVQRFPPLLFCACLGEDSKYQIFLKVPFLGWP